MENNSRPTSYNVNGESKCPFLPEYVQNKVREMVNELRLVAKPIKLNILRQNSLESNPMGAHFNYAEEFKSVDLEALKKDITDVITTSQDWWPADYGSGPFFIQCRNIPYCGWSRRSWFRNPTFST
jgi:catalase-peroxidase